MARSSRPSASALTVLVLLTAGCLCASAAAPAPAAGAGAVDVSGMEGVQTDERGSAFITTADGEKWVVLGDSAASRFFLHDKTKSIAYADPRTSPPRETTEADVEGAEKDESDGHYYITAQVGGRWSVHKDPATKRFYYHNAEAKVTMWEDPRAPINAPRDPVKGTVAKAPVTATEKLKISMVATVPVLMFLAGLAARIYYLHTHHPEMLFPTKERKDRRRSASGKFKAQKARGKMSQDGKGGRSANS